MKQCKTDPCLFVKHDKNNRLILWAVTYIDDVVYGGLKSETINFKHHYKPIKLRRPLDLRVRSHVDTDWASDRNDRKSITSLLTAIGFVCLLN